MVNFLPAVPFPFLREYDVAETVWIPLCNSANDGRNTFPLVSPANVYGATFSIRTRCLPSMSKITDDVAGSGDDGLANIVSLLPTSLKYTNVPLVAIVPKFTFVTVSKRVKLSMFCADTNTDMVIKRFHPTRNAYNIIIIITVVVVVVVVIHR
jgi:hypothetical protein